MVTKFKHHMRLNFLNLVSTLCIEKKHSLLQMRHQAGCEHVNNRLVFFSSLSFLHWHLLICHVFILHRLLKGEGSVKNDKKEKVPDYQKKIVSKGFEPINRRSYHIIMYYNNVTT